jgi:hypothetical protein
MRGLSELTLFGPGHRVWLWLSNLLPTWNKSFKASLLSPTAPRMLWLSGPWKTSSPTAKISMKRSSAEMRISLRVECWSTMR